MVDKISMAGAKGSIVAFAVVEEEKEIEWVASKLRCFSIFFVHFAKSSAQNSEALNVEHRPNVVTFLRNYPTLYLPPVP